MLFELHNSVLEHFALLFSFKSNEAILGVKNKSFCTVYKMKIEFLLYEYWWLIVQRHWRNSHYRSENLARISGRNQITSMRLVGVSWRQTLPRSNCRSRTSSVDSTANPRRSSTLRSNVAAAETWSNVRPTLTRTVGQAEACSESEGWRKERKVARVVSELQPGSLLRTRYICMRWTLHKQERTNRGR